jgi:hypothetical protein
LYLTIGSFYGIEFQKLSSFGCPMNRSIFLKYFPIAIVLLLPFGGLIGYALSRNIITPNDELFVIDKGETPEINIDTWNLSIYGHVNNSKYYNYANFTSLSSTEVLATIQCVEGPSGTAIWKGVSVKALLDIVEVQLGAVDVVFYAADGYSSSLTLEEVNNEDVILAYEMNGEPLPIEQGYPLRVVAPNYYGYKWVKWVVRVEIVTYDYIGYWESRGWNDNAYATPFSSWIVHALLLSVAFLAGGLAVMSGLRRSPVTEYFWDLPKFFGVRFHKIVSLIYFLTATGTFSYWIIYTLLNRGAILYTIHGIAALLSIIFLVPSVITGLKKTKRRDANQKTRHYKWSTASFFVFLTSVLLGFLLVFTGSIRLY